MRATISYNCEYKSNVRTLSQHDDSTICNVYRSPIVDSNVDLDMESEGYHPVGGCKDMYSKFVVYDKTCDAHRYKDCGMKHLYESHHLCRGAKEGKYCNLFCTSHLSSMNFKKDDMYQVENEEMVCTDTEVNYGQLDSFFVREMRQTCILKCCHFLR